MGIGNTLTAPGISSGLMGVLLSVGGAGSSWGISSDVFGEDEGAARGGDGVVIMSSKRRARFFTDINSLFSDFVVVVVVVVYEVFEELRVVSNEFTGGVD